jgi:hypothetical protein
MKNRPFPFIIIWFLALILGCNSGSFAGSSNTSGSNASGPTPAPSVPPPDCQITGDQVQLNPHNTTIMDCINKGMIYHFAWGKCTNIPKAVSFECSFSGVKDAVAKLNMPTTSIDEAINDKSKLIGCGEKKMGDHNDIIIQWWKADGDACTFDGSTTKTVCFQDYGTNQKPPAPKNQDETDERVRQCIEE